MGRASGTRRWKPPDLSPPVPHSRTSSWLLSQAPPVGTDGPVFGWAGTLVVVVVMMVMVVVVVVVAAVVVVMVAQW